jgi:hypothetical protein
MTRVSLYAAMAAMTLAFGARIARAQDIDFPEAPIDTGPTIIGNPGDLGMQTLDPSGLSSRVRIPDNRVPALAPKTAPLAGRPPHFESPTCEPSQTECDPVRLRSVTDRQDPAAARSSRTLWIDIGHWTWIHRDKTYDSPSGEVYYAPASVAAESDSHTFVRDVVVKIDWNVDLRGVEYIDRSDISFKGHRFWRLAIRCNENSWARAWQRSLHAHDVLSDHGLAQGPYKIAADSVPAILKNRLCR